MDSPERVCISSLLEEASPHSIVAAKLRAGRELLKQKKKIGHGRWVRWLNECGFCSRSVNKCMQLARYEELIPGLGSCKSMNRALALIRDYKKENRRSKPKIVPNKEIKEYSEINTVVDYLRGILPDGVAPGKSRIIRSIVDGDIPGYKVGETLLVKVRDVEKAFIRPVKINKLFEH